MLINDFDVVEFGARQWNVTPGFTTVKNNSEWAAGALTPYLADNYMQMAALKVALLVKGDGRDAILLQSSDLIAQLLHPVTMVLDGFSRQFVGSVSKWSLTESSRRRFHLLTIEASGYWEDIGDIVVNKTVASGADIVISNPGNIPTPVRIKVTASGSASTLTLTGAGRTITVTGVSANDVIILDGRTGLFTVNGSVSGSITAWELPRLQPGDSTLKVTGAGGAVEVTYRPRYM